MKNNNAGDPPSLCRAAAGQVVGECGMKRGLYSLYSQAQNRQYFSAEKFVLVLAPVALRSILQVASPVPYNHNFHLKVKL